VGADSQGHSTERAYPRPEEDGDAQDDEADKRYARGDEEPPDPRGHRVTVVPHLLTIALTATMREHADGLRTVARSGWMAGARVRL
jgi:hypothetical protein